MSEIDTFTDYSQIVQSIQTALMALLVMQSNEFHLPIA